MSNKLEKIFLVSSLLTLAHNEKALKKWGIRSTHFQYTTNEN
jgi:hypothetical protein